MPVTEPLAGEYELTRFGLSLIQPLGTGLVAFGSLQVYQRTVIATGFEVPDWLQWLGTGLSYGLPNSLIVFVPSPR